MTWVAVAVGVGGAAAGAYGASKSASAAKSAANAQAQSAADANASQERMLDKQLAAAEPFRQNGLVAQNQYMRMLGLQPYSAQTSATGYSYDPGQAYLQANPDVANDPYFSQNPQDHYQRYGINEGRTWQATNPAQQQASNQPYDATAERNKAFDLFRSTPGYQFGLEEGVRGLDASASSSSGLYSGKAGKALARYMGNYADQQGYRPYMNDLASLSGMSQQQTQNNAALSMQAASNMGQNTMAAGNARASGIMGAANAWNNYLGNMANMAGSMYGAYRGGGR